jgi:hypothetical protein
MGRIVEFADGFSSASAPDSLRIISDAARQFADDAAYVTNKGSAAANGDFYYNTTSHVLRVYANGAWGNVGTGGGASVKNEFRTITGGEETAKQLTLSNTPTTASEVVLSVHEGSVGFYGVDYTVSGATLSWNGLGLDGLLTSGERVVISYTY